MSDTNVTSDVVRKENSFGVEKDYVQVGIGTTVYEVRRHLRNPITGRREDLAELSDDGYLKPFLAVLYAHKSDDIVDLERAPVLTFDTDRWTVHDRGETVWVVKDEAESRLGEMVLDDMKQAVTDHD